MIIRIPTLIALILSLVSTVLVAQEEVPNNLNSEKIKGARFTPFASYPGKPFLNDKFASGEIEFNDGSKIENLKLRYNSLRDEIIYFNNANSSHIIIDKISLKGFSFTQEDGIKRVFRRQYYDGYLHEERFFELLSGGRISLLCYRKADLETCDTSISKSGLNYESSFKYYAYSPEKGYLPLKLTRSSLLSKFSKPNQKLAKRVLRKNKIQIADEAGFIAAWNLILSNKIPIDF